MKKLTILLLLSCIHFLSFQIQQVYDEYKVIKVTGVIVLSDTQKILTRGDILYENETLDFRTPGAIAAVINAKKGRFILSEASQNNNEAKTNWIPAMTNISSRAGNLLNIIDLKNHFNGKYLFLDTVYIRIGAESFPMNEQNLFFLKYNYKGEKIHKKLKFKDDTLIFDKYDIFTIDGQTVEIPDVKNMALYYMIDKNKYSLINEFAGVFPDEKELKQEISIIIEESDKLSDEEKMNLVIAYLNDFYGKPNKENIHNWLTKNYN